VTNRDLLTKVIVPIASAAGIAGGTHVLGKLNTKRLMRVADKQIAEMEAEHPLLRTLPHDAKRKAYAAIVRHAPRMAHDPYVGGELMLDLVRGGRRVAALRDAATVPAQPRARNIIHDSIRHAHGELAGEVAQRAINKIAHTETHMKTAALKDIVSGIRGSLGSATAAIGNKWNSLDERTRDKVISAGLPVASSAAAALTSYAVPAAVEAVRASRIRANRDKYLEEMKKVHPDMRTINDQDLHIAYNSIAQHTPDVLKDPLLGGQTLKQMAQFRMANVQALNEISRLRGIKPLDNAIMNATGMLSQGLVDSGKSYLAHTGDVARAAAEQARHADNIKQKEDDRKLRRSEYTLKRSDSEQRDSQVADELALNRAKLEAEIGHKREELDFKRTVEELKATVQSLQMAPRTVETAQFVHNPNTGKDEWQTSEIKRDTLYDPDALKLWNTTISNAANASTNSKQTAYSAPALTFKKRK
jgi:hypothetical protein